MLVQELERLQSDLFRSLNQFVTPLVQAGLGSPFLWPAGAIVVETKGRKSGRTYNIPLWASRIADLLVVSTARRRSEWVKNLAANKEVGYWMNGRRREATAVVFGPGLEAPQLENLPPLARCLATALTAQSSLLGVSFAILIPQSRRLGL